MLNQKNGHQPLSLKALLLLGLAAFLLFLPGRAVTPPFDRDEPRYMEATAQMLESHNFVDVRFQDKPRYLQPAGIYWLEAAAVSITGMQHQRVVWPYRIPSLLAMSGAVVLTALIGSMLFGASAGLGAGLLFMASVLVAAESRMATIDSCLLLTVLLAQLALTGALRDRQQGVATPIKRALLYWGAIGCGLMLKGPVILIPSLATPLVLGMLERDFGLWRRMRPAWGWLLSAAILVPWCVAIGVVSHGEFFRNAVGTNFLGKVASGQQAHGLPPGYHLLVFLLAFWPGSFLRPAWHLWFGVRVSKKQCAICCAGLFRIGWCLKRLRQNFRITCCLLIQLLPFLQQRFWPKVGTYGVIGLREFGARCCSVFMLSRGLWWALPWPLLARPWSGCWSTKYPQLLLFWPWAYCRWLALQHGIFHAHACNRPL